MTVTAIESAPSAQKPGTVLHLERALPLWRAVSNAMLFAHSDDTLPMLSAVRFERDAKGKLHLVSTDRYRIFDETVEHKAGEDAGEFAFSLPLSDCKQLANALKTAGRLGGAMLVVEETRLRVQVGDIEITLRFLEDVSFPKWQKLIPDVESATETVGLAFNPKFLADLGKLKLDSSVPARFLFFGHNKPALIRLTDNLLVLQMPVRMSEPEPAKAAETKTSEETPAAKAA